MFFRKYLRQIALKYSYIFRSICKFFNDDSMLIALCSSFLIKDPFSLQLPQTYPKSQQAINDFLIIIEALLSRFSPQRISVARSDSLDQTFVLTQLSMDFEEVTSTRGPKGSNLEQQHSQVRYIANSLDFIEMLSHSWNKQVTEFLQIQLCFTLCDFFSLQFFGFFCFWFFWGVFLVFLINL